MPKILIEQKARITSITRCSIQLRLSLSESVEAEPDANMNLP